MYMYLMGVRSRKGGGLLMLRQKENKYVSFHRRKLALFHQKKKKSCESPKLHFHGIMHKQSAE